MDISVSYCKHSNFWGKNQKEFLTFFGAQKEAKKHPPHPRPSPIWEGCNRSSCRSYINVSSTHHRGGMRYYRRLAFCWSAFLSDSAQGMKNFFFFRAESILYYYLWPLYEVEDRRLRNKNKSPFILYFTRFALSLHLKVNGIAFHWRIWTSFIMTCQPATLLLLTSLNGFGVSPYSMTIMI